MKPLFRSTTVLLLLVAAVGCATTNAGASRSDPDLITHAEIEASEARNVHELIQRLRPRWLMTRGSRSVTMTTSTLVFLNNARLGGLDMLPQISTGGVTSIRYLDAAQATAQLPGIGSQHVEGAIVISTRQQDRDRSD